MIASLILPSFHHHTEIGHWLPSEEYWASRATVKDGQVGLPEAFHHSQIARWRFALDYKLPGWPCAVLA